MLQEALIEFAKLSFDKDKIKDTAVNSALSIEANKHHGREVDPTTLPGPDKPKFPSTDIIRGFGDVVENIIDKKLGLDLELTPVIEEQKALESLLTSKYEEILIKYNETLSLLQDNAKGVGNLMSEFSQFKSDVVQNFDSFSLRLDTIEQRVSNKTDGSKLNRSSTPPVRVSDLKNKE